MLVVRRVSWCKLGGLVLQRHNAHIIGTVCKRKPQDLVYSLIVYPYVTPHELQRKPSFSGSMSITIPARLLMEELLFPPPGGILEGPRDFPRSHLMTNDSRTHPATQPLRKIYESGGSSGGKTSAPKTITWLLKRTISIGNTSSNYSGGNLFFPGSSQTAMFIRESWNDPNWLQL